MEPVVKIRDTIAKTHAKVGGYEPCSTHAWICSQINELNPPCHSLTCRQYTVSPTKM